MERIKTPHDGLGAVQSLYTDGVADAVPLSTASSLSSSAVNPQLLRDTCLVPAGVYPASEYWEAKTLPNYVIFLTNTIAQSLWYQEFLRCR